MEHSVIEYVKRLPTERLEQFLLQCMQDSQAEDYAYIVPNIKQVLAARSAENSDKHIETYEK